MTCYGGGNECNPRKGKLERNPLPSVVGGSSLPVSFELSIAPQADCYCDVCREENIMLMI